MPRLAIASDKSDIDHELLRPLWIALAALLWDEDGRSRRAGSVSVLPLLCLLLALTPPLLSAVEEDRDTRTPLSFVVSCLDRFRLFGEGVAAVPAAVAGGRGFIEMSSAE